MSDFSFASVARGMQGESQSPEVEPVEQEVQASDSQPTASDTVSPAVTETPVVETPVEAPLPEQPSTPSFIEYMRTKGYDVDDDVDPQALYETALERISASAAAFSRLQQLESELAALKTAPPPAAPVAAAAPPPPVETAVTQEQQRHFRELQKYDLALEQFVTRDGQGNAVPRMELGTQAIEAAQKINAYEKMERDQAALLLQNPNLLLSDFKSDVERIAEEKAKALVEQQIAAWRAEQEKQTQELTAAQQAAAEERQALEWHEANKAKLFKLAPNGEPAKMPFDDTAFQFTPMGIKFRERLTALQSRYPGANRIDLMNDALEYASLVAPQPAAPVATPAQQRQMFSTQRTPHSTPPAATASELLPQTGQKLAFSALARALPETADIMANWQR